MKTLTSRKWWAAAGIRSLKTGAEVALSMLVTNTFVMEVNWRAVASAVALSMICSLLINIKGIPEVDIDLEVDNDNF